MESVEEESEGGYFPKNYKMKIMKNSQKQISKNQQIKNRLENRLSYWNLNQNQIKQTNEMYHKSKTQTLNKEDLTEEWKEEKDQIRIIKLDESGDWNKNNISKQKSEEPEERITIKFKWASNFRSRKGSEDIALNRIGSTQACKESTSFNEGRAQMGAFKRENSGQSNQNELAYVTSFEHRLENVQSNKGYKMMLEPSSKKLVQINSVDNEGDCANFGSNQKDNKTIYEKCQHNPLNIFDRIQLEDEKNRQERRNKPSDLFNPNYNNFDKVLDDCEIQEIWQEGWLTRNVVYYFDPNENENIFKHKSNRK